MKLACQIILIVYLIVTLLSALHIDFNGREARPAKNFDSVIWTLIIIGLLTLVMIGAGTFNK